MGLFLPAGAGCVCPLSGPWYLPVFGSGPGSVPGLAAATSHSFSSFPSSSHVCAASEQSPSSENPEENRKKGHQLPFFCFFYKKVTEKWISLSAEIKTSSDTIEKTIKSKPRCTQCNNSILILIGQIRLCAVMLSVLDTAGK